MIVRDMLQSADPDIIDAIADERFKDKRHLSTEVFEREPWESIWMARTVWAADAKREALDKKRRS